MDEIGEGKVNDLSLQVRGAAEVLYRCILVGVGLTISLTIRPFG